MSAPPSNFRLCFLFKIDRGTDCQVVKENVEDTIARPDGIRSVLLDYWKRYYVIQCDNDDVWKALYKNRKRIFIGPVRAVVVFPRNIVENVKILLDKELLAFANRQLDVSAPLYEGVRVFPIVGFMTPWSMSEVTAENLIQMITFMGNLSALLFGDGGIIAQLVTKPPEFLSNPDDPTATSPCPPSRQKARTRGMTTWTRVNVNVQGILCVVEVGRGDIFNTSEQAIVQGIVVPVNLMLRCDNTFLDQCINQYIGLAYGASRLAKLGKDAVTFGDVVTFEARGSSTVQFFLLAVTDENGDISSSDLIKMYTKVFFKASELKLVSLAFAPFVFGKLQMSAESAAYALIASLASSGLKPRLVLFVHHSLASILRFGDFFAKFCTKYAKGDASIEIDDEEGKMDVAMASATPLPAPAKDSDAAVAQLLQSLETGNLKRSRASKPRQYGKRSDEEKLGKKKQTKEDRENEAVGRAMDFITFLEKEFPPQYVCSACEGPLMDDDADDDASPVEEPENCQRCYRPYHTRCLDESHLGGCVFCVNQFSPKNGVITGDQPADGTMSIRIVQDADMSVPGYRQNGHIEIIYNMASGIQQMNHPKPGAFCFGAYKVAYLPNTDEGKRMAAMLRVAFEFRLIFCVKKSLSFTGDYSVAWSFIPHKTSLTGGRAKGGYPDETYMLRITRLLNQLGIHTPTEVPTF